MRAQPERERRKPERRTADAEASRYLRSRQHGFPTRGLASRSCPPDPAGADAGGARLPADDGRRGEGGGGPDRRSGMADAGWRAFRRLPSHAPGRQHRPPGDVLARRAAVAGSTCGARGRAGAAATPRVCADCAAAHHDGGGAGPPSRGPGGALYEPRTVGRAALPTTTIGLLFHAAEHRSGTPGRSSRPRRSFEGWKPGLDFSPATCAMMRYAAPRPPRRNRPRPPPGRRPRSVPRLLCRRAGVRGDAAAGPLCGISWRGRIPPPRCAEGVGGGGRGSRAARTVSFRHPLS